MLYVDDCLPTPRTGGSREAVPISLPGSHQALSRPRHMWECLLKRRKTDLISSSIIAFAAYSDKSKLYKANLEHGVDRGNIDYLHLCLKPIFIQQQK